MLNRGTMTAIFLAVALTPAVTVATALAVGGQDAAAVARGQEVYTAQKCQLCHAVAGKGNKTNPLDGVGAKLSAADVDALVAYLQSLK
jgi:mono/diheme cytochrome c family protein